MLQPSFFLLSLHFYMLWCCNSNFFTCGLFSLCVPFYCGGITHDKGGSQSQSSQSNLVEKFLHNARVVSIGEINNLRQVINWTVLSLMWALPLLCFVIYYLPCFRIVTAWLLGQLKKSSLMLHGVMTVVLTVPPHLIHQKVAQLVVLAKTVWPIQFHG